MLIHTRLSYVGIVIVKRVDYIRVYIIYSCVVEHAFKFINIDCY